MIKKLVSSVGEYKKPALLAPLTMVGEVIMEVLIPLVMAQMIDNGIQKGKLQYAVLMGLLMVGMSLLSLCFGMLSAKFAARASMGFAKNLRRRLFRKVQDFSFKNVDSFSTASLVTRLTTDVNNAQQAFMMSIRMAVRAPLMLISATILSIMINPKLSLVFLVAIPILGLSLYFILTNAHPRFRKMLKLYDTMNSKVQENLTGIRVVKAFVREDYENDKFKTAANDVRKAQVMAEKLVILNMPIMQLLMYGTTVAVIWFGGNMVIKGTFLIGQLSSFISYIMQILMSLMMISMIFMMLVISRASLTRICEVLDSESDIVDPKNPVTEVKNGEIEFSNVCFNYNGKEENYILDNINFKINSGETIGIIGATGSAKSTLVQLIPRLYDVTSGEIRVGEVPIKNYQLKTLRDSVAMVLQKNVLFSGTIKDNLKWGNENATDEQIIKACKAACAHDFITEFPNGYDTYLGQGGVNVSGGQKQRLCIARALLKSPKIIILDDSTSAVDTATDSKIRSEFKNNLGGITTIIIAQRISSVQDSDRIIVIDDGKINAIGTHEELLNSNEIYKEVYNSQQKGEEK